MVAGILIRDEKLKWAGPCSHILHSIVILLES